MTVHYRPIYFAPTWMPHFRFPVAALVHAGTTKSVVIARRLPEAGCLGDGASARLLQLEVDALSRARSVEEVQLLTGPSIVVGDPTELRIPATEAVSWVAANVLPTHRNERAREKVRAFREQIRRKAGESFLRQFQVAQYVKPTFKPGVDLEGMFARDSLLDPIEQWVAGSNDVLLMEPLATQLRAFEAHAHEARMRLGAYREIIVREDFRSPRRPLLVAYVLGGGDKHIERERAIDSLRQVATVYDVSDRREKLEFIDLVRSTGESGGMAFA